VQFESGVEQGDDAAVVEWPATQLVQSVDQLRALIDDPYTFGKIATLHALSDVYAQNARAHSAQVLITVPFAKPSLVKRELSQLMRGVVTVLNEEHCVLLGGHTAEGAELQVGLVVNAEPNPLTHDHAEQSTDPRTDPLEEYALVLTKPLGVGVLFAGLMQTKTKGADVDAALNSMLQSNADAAAICKRHGMPVCTDVTGFGLLGHLQRLALREGVSVEIHEENVPVLEGVHDLVNQGVQSSLSAANQSMLDPIPALSGLSKSNRVIFTGTSLHWLPECLCNWSCIVRP